MIILLKLIKKISDIGDYISMKINSKAKTENIIKNNISINLNGLWVKDPNLNNTKIVKKIDKKTLKIARTTSDMHDNYLIIKYEKVGF